MSDWRLDDLWCWRCERMEIDLLYRRGSKPRCLLCGKIMKIAITTPRAIDSFATPRYFDSSGQSHSSRRDLKKYMRDKGFEEAGDKQHGGRVDLTLKETSFSIPGLSCRSPSERAQDRKLASREFHRSLERNSRTKAGLESRRQKALQASAKEERR